MNNQEWEVKMNDLREAQAATQHLLDVSAERHDREIAELRESQVVTQRLMDLDERRWKERFEQNDNEIRVLRENSSLLHRNIAALHEDIAALHQDVGSLHHNVAALAENARDHRQLTDQIAAAMASLISHIDRFIQGRGTNGH
jgi:chromosome segregation ATPase